MLRLYDTLSETEKEFRPIDGKTARFYTCGPTVYNFAHIGNLRTYIFEDILRKAIKRDGFGTLQVMNITDVDDKIIREVKEKGSSIEEITRPYEKAFFEDLDKLNIERPEVTPRATEHIEEMALLIKKLLDKGVAYKADDGSIYFSISKFPEYGKLTKIDKEGLKAGARVDQDEYEKADPGDFALWKAKKEGEPSWKTSVPEIPEGRPGWHIECSAMSIKYLGETFDIHTGGVDNAFPHHENEIAQSEAATGKPFSKIWMHAEHLLVDGKKMSKSAGNFFTLRDLEEKGFAPLSFRYLVLGAQYRTRLNFTIESLSGAASALDNLREKIISGEENSERDEKAELNYLHEFDEAIENDLNTPEALAVAWKAAKDQGLSRASKKALAQSFDEVLGLNLLTEEEIIPEEIRLEAEEREKAREARDFMKSDDIRMRLEEKGYLIEDTAKGPVIRIKK